MKDQQQVACVWRSKVKLLSIIFGSSMLLLMLLQNNNNSSDKTDLNPEEDKFCRSLKNHRGSKLNIMIIGLRLKSIILITNDWMTYDLPLKSLNSKKKRLKLFKPLPMSKKYPRLWNDARFQAIRGDILDAIVMRDSVGEYLCFMTRDARKGLGINYDLNAETISDGWQNNVWWNNKMISTDKNSTFHTITRQFNGILIDEWQTFRSPHRIEQIIQYRAICWDLKPTRLIIKTTNDMCQTTEPIGWSLIKGFVGKGYFHLFDVDRVHIFPYRSFNGSKSVELSTISYKKFFRCTDDELFAPANNVWIIIESVWLLLLIILSLFLYFDKLSQLCCPPEQTPFIELGVNGST